MVVDERKVLPLLRCCKRLSRRGEFDLENEKCGIEGATFKDCGWFSSWKKRANDIPLGKTPFKWRPSLPPCFADHPNRFFFETFLLSG